jgi:hypothetical protein
LDFLQTANCKLPTGFLRANKSILFFYLQEKKFSPAISDFSAKFFLSLTGAETFDPGGFCYAIRFSS